MLVTVVLAVVALVGQTAEARPASNLYVKLMAKAYAKQHPNTETEINEEYGDLYDGDIILREGDKVETNPLNAVRDPELLWPNGIAYYTIENGAYTASEIAAIEAGIRDLQELTRVGGEYCIRILPRNNQGDYIRVENYSGCSSYVGRIGGSQRMSLVPNCVSRHGTIMHEFLHAFGFHHEQKRYDRDDWVTINWDNIQPGTENNFVMLTENQITLLGTPYDYGSVLHYSAYAFAVDPNVPTIIPHDPDAVIGQRVTLSQLDIERVQILYGCLDAADSVHFRHIKSREELFN
jgi:hypothetical protein